MNWFEDVARRNFEICLIPTFAHRSVRCLQIGVYAGDASLWLLDHVLGNSDSVLVDVDHWLGSDEPDLNETDWRAVEALYDARTLASRESGTIVKYKGSSDSFFKSNEESFDFIYIDGDHSAHQVLKDAVAGYECLNSGGIIAFDDYLWTSSLGPLHQPAMAVDAFGAIYAGKVELLHQGYQCWFRRHT
ncbi:MAG: class I SAM-dependent methyltransferase [Actinomycetota bacterium]